MKRLIYRRSDRFREKVKVSSEVGEELYRIYEHMHKYDDEKDELIEKHPYLLYLYNKLNGAWEDIRGALFFKLSEYGESECLTNEKAKDFADELIEWYTSKMRDNLLRGFECTPIKPELFKKGKTKEVKKKWVLYRPYLIPLC